MQLLSNYDLYILGVGIILLGISAFNLLFYSISFISNDGKTITLYSGLTVKQSIILIGISAILYFLHTWACSEIFQDSSFCRSEFEWSFLSSLVLLTLGLYSLYSLLPLHMKTSWDNMFLKSFLMLGFFLHLISMGASSLVEEEHQVWYFLSATLSLILIYLDAYNCKIAGVAVFSFRNMTHWILMLLCGRIIRGWNQTGNKWMGSPDYVTWLHHPNHKNFLYGLWILSVLIITIHGLFYVHRLHKYFHKFVNFFFFWGELVYFQIIYYCGISSFRTCSKLHISFLPFLYFCTDGILDPS